MTSRVVYTKMGWFKYKQPFQILCCHNELFKSTISAFVRLCRRTVLNVPPLERNSFALTDVFYLTQCSCSAFWDVVLYVRA